VISKFEHFTFKLESQPLNILPLN